jgi:peptide/nickel transport system permease protein
VVDRLTGAAVSPMIGRLARRLSLAALTLLVTTALLYEAIRLVPGTPWADDLSTPRERIEEWKRLHHLDRNPAIGYLMWLGDAVRGDLGTSYKVAYGEPVAGLVLGAAPTSITLGVLGIGAALLLAVITSLASARRPGGPWDRFWTGALYLLHAAPTFWVAMVLQDLFAARLRVLPAFGSGPATAAGGATFGAIAAHVSFWILPSACLALGSLAFLFRFARAILVESAASPWVRAARGRGISTASLMYRHTLAGAAVHFITLLGMLAPSIVAGSVIVERIFALPGLGRLFLDAVSNRDYPVVMGVGLLITLVTIAASAAADMLYLAVDPRLRTSPEGGA